MPRDSRSPFQVVSASFVAGAPRTKDLPSPTLVEVAFCGRSNVGKSSLLNCMMQRKDLVRTSRTPGCTQQINLFHVQLKSGLELQLADLPGYGYARVSKSTRSEWGSTIEEYLLGRPSLRAAVILCDVRRGAEGEERALADFLATRPRGVGGPLPCILVATKLDKLPVSGHKPALVAIQKFCGQKPLGFSSVTAQGRDELWERLTKMLGASGEDSG